MSDIKFIPMRGTYQQAQYNLDKVSEFEMFILTDLKLFCTKLNNEIVPLHEIVEVDDTVEIGEIGKMYLKSDGLYFVSVDNKLKPLYTFTRETDITSGEQIVTKKLRIFINKYTHKW